MLFETICIQNGAIQHLSLHQKRLDRSQAALFENFESIDLGKILRPPTGTGTLKCRVLYAERLIDVTYEPYRPRSVKTLRIVESDLDYGHKFRDRDTIDELFAQKGDADEILIVKKGLVTDTSIANVAFLKEKPDHVFFDEVDTAGVCGIQAVFVNDHGQTFQPLVPAFCGDIFINTLTQ